MISFIIGVFVGANISLFFYALIIAAGRERDE